MVQLYPRDTPLAPSIQECCKRLAGACARLRSSSSAPVSWRAGVLSPDSMKPLCVAFLGCGFITRVHSRHLRSFGGSLMRVYASRDPVKAETYCREFGGAGSYGSYAAAI